MEDLTIKSQREVYYFVFFVAFYDECLKSTTDFCLIGNIRESDIINWETWTKLSQAYSNSWCKWCDEKPFQCVVHGRRKDLLGDFSKIFPGGGQN